MFSIYHARAHTQTALVFHSVYCKLQQKGKVVNFVFSKANIHIKLMVATIILAFSTLIITFQIITPILDYGEFSLMVSPT